MRGGEIGIKEGSLAMLLAFADLVWSGPRALCADVPWRCVWWPCVLFFCFHQVQGTILVCPSIHSPCGRCHGSRLDFFPWGRKELWSSFLTTQKLREAHSAEIQTLPYPAILPTTFILWPSVYIWVGEHCILQGDLPPECRVGSGAKAHHFPLNLPVWPPFPSLCHLLVYCFSFPNPYFFALFCDMGSGLENTSPLPAGLMLGFVNRGTELKGRCKAIDRGGFPLPFLACWFSVGYCFQWTAVQGAQWHSAAFTGRSGLRPGSSPFTPSNNVSAAWRGCSQRPVDYSLWQRLCL